MLSRKVLDAVRFVMRSDPALDVTDAQYDEYRKTWDFGKLKFKDGQVPTVFLLGQLGDQQSDACYRHTAAIDTANTAIRYGLINLENYSVEDALGNKSMVPSPERGQTDLGSAITTAWMEKARLAPEEKIILGKAILDMTQAKPPLS